MNTHKLLWLVPFLALLAMLPACRTSTSSSASRVASSVPAELRQQTYLFEILRHLYRWHLDESEVENTVGSQQCVFWVRRLDHRLDPGDQSELGEIILPQLKISVRVKRANYRIEELGTDVKSRNFKITQVFRGQIPGRPPKGCVVVSVDMKEMRDYLFRTRNQQDFPDATLIERLRGALRAEAVKEGLIRTNTAFIDHVIHLAPLSPVANESWVYWEAGRKLLYFASDIDLANPVVWQNEPLMVRIYDLDQQVVVSHEEAPGSNRFLTRAEVGRALFNCLILGQRVTVPPYVPPGAPGSGPAGTH